MPAIPSEKAVRANGARRAARLGTSGKIAPAASAGLLKYDAADDAQKSYYAAIEARRLRGDAHDWPADRVERRPIADLIDYARNARTHSPAQVDQLAASMREWGFTVPVLVDENSTLIAGHGRVLAARKLGFPTIPVMVARGWTPAQIAAYRIADNQLALNAGWDEALLALDLADLDERLRQMTGFADEAIENLLRQKEFQADPDDAPPLPVEPQTRPGDLWQCGRHRLLCGDATRAEDVARLLGGVKPNLMVTDPPYGVDYEADWRTHARNADGSLLSTGKGRAKGKVTNDGEADWREAYALFFGDVAYVWCAGTKSHVVAASLESRQFDMRAMLVWAKQHFVIGRGDYHEQKEVCWYAVRKGGKGRWQGDRTQSTLWQIDKPQKSETGHSTQKPVECMRRPIVNNSAPGQPVYDPFVGSGTTMIAAEMEGRHALCMEISPAYCDVVKTRWETFTGGKAKLLK